MISSSSSIQFWFGFIPINKGGWIYPTLPAISPTPTLHLAWFFASSFFKPTLLFSFSTCDLHVFLGRPRFLFPFASNSNAFLKTWSSPSLICLPKMWGICYKLLSRVPTREENWWWKQGGGIHSYNEIKLLPIPHDFLLTTISKNYPSPTNKP